MKLKECIELARECGMFTLGEAYDNVAIHATSLFVWDNIEEEMQELRKEIVTKYQLECVDNTIDNIMLKDIIL